jgi:bacterioferritin-associated ferredoxin
MYVCVCHAVTDRQVRSAIASGARSLFEVQQQLPVGGCCGRCTETVETMLEEEQGTPVSAAA